MSAWQSAQDRSACTDALYLAGSTCSEIPGKGGAFRGTFCGPPGLTLLSFSFADQERMPESP
jgi:hypothetical protein